MKYIRPCSNCKKELRFPLDKGILIIKCPHCTYSFKVDPDEPFTFQGGRFDYQIKQYNQSSFIDKKSIPIFFSTIFELIKDLFFKLKNNIKLNIKTIILFLIIISLALNLYKIFYGSSNYSHIKIENFINTPQENFDKQFEPDTDYESPKPTIDEQNIPYKI